jgi:hypothetical protein
VSHSTNEQRKGWVRRSRRCKVATSLLQQPYDRMTRSRRESQGAHSAEHVSKLSERASWTPYCMTALTWLSLKAAAALRDARRWGAYVAMAFGLLLLLFTASFIYDVYHPERQGPTTTLGYCSCLHTARRSLGVKFQVVHSIETCEAEVAKQQHHRRSNELPLSCSTDDLQSRAFSQECCGRPADCARRQPSTGSAGRVRPSGSGVIGSKV